MPLDVPHRAQIMRLCSADSNALEAVYRQRKDELEAAWWQARQAVAAFLLYLEDIHDYCCCGSNLSHASVKSMPTAMA